MNRFLIVAAFVCFATPAVAQQQTISFSGIPNDAPLVTSAPAGFTLFGPGDIQNGQMYVWGGDAITTYLASATGFTVNSLDITSQISTNNRILLRGYTLADISAWTAAHPLQPDFFAALRSASQLDTYPATFSYFIQFTADPTVARPVALNWTGVAALAFDSQGGDAVSPLAPGWPGYGFFADNISVTVTPEPRETVLLLTGLLALAGAARRRSS